MEVGFSVAGLGLGPISEVSINREIVSAAVYLARKSYGWYKAKERILSLQETLKSSGVELVAASTFDKDHYLEYVQKHGTTWGIAVTMSNIASRVKLPRASTAMEGLSGSLCLRALTMGLLCFVDKDQVPFILKDILPSCMFHYDQLETEVVIEGPLLAALKQYVLSVDTEEGADDLRSKILNYTDTQLRRLTHASTVDVKASEPTELGHITGLVEWLLTPTYKRQTSFYRTRSLKVWCLALVLSNWFDVEVDRTAITTPPGPSGPAMGFEYYSNKSIVVLVLAPGWSTDQARKFSDTKYDMVHTAVFAPPRVITVRTFPAISYTDYVASNKSQRRLSDARQLEDGFLGSYAFVRYVLSSDEKIRHLARISEPILTDEERHASLSKNPQNDEAVKEMLEEFRVSGASSLPGGSEDTDYILDRITTPVLAQYLLPWKQSANLEQMYLMVDHIRLATVLAVISLFVRYGDDEADESGLEMPLVYTESLCFRDSGSKLLKEYFTTVIAFLRGVLCEKLAPNAKKYIWENGVPKSSMSAARLHSWSSLVLKVILDLDNTTENSEVKDRHWGRQKQGLVMLRDFALRPSGRPSSSYIFHALQGHLLDVPTLGGRIIDGISTTPTLPSSNAYLTDKANIITKLQLPAPQYVRSLRIDLEPCWESDANTCRFVLRAGGLPKLQLNMTKFFSDLHENKSENMITRIRCSGSCPGPKSMHQLMFNHPSETNAWGFLPIQDMVEQRWLGFSHANDELPNNEDRETNNWLVRTYESNVLLALALHCPYVGSRTGRHKIVTDCLGTALMARGPWSSHTTMIILANEKHNFLWDVPGPAYLPRDDLLRTATSIVFNYLEMHLYGSFYTQACNFICSTSSIPYRNPTDISPILKRLIYYRDNKGITESGVFDVLQAVIQSHLLKSVSTADDNEAGIAWVDSLILKWQIENFSALQFSIMKGCIAGENKELNRARKLAREEHEEWVDYGAEEEEGHW
ncbi:hypothetical protein MMC18_009377 [Xylographa bjoerkii]|nr:hypothetical protein [Xylographa bjoerkii]